MGIKLHGTHNAFTTLLKNNRHVVTTIDPSIIDSWGRFNNILLKAGTQSAFDYLQELSMERLQNYRELVRNTMLSHEETFRQQVHDLHRLYRVQKMLMAEMRNKEEMLRSHRSRGFTDTKTRFQGGISTSETSHSAHVSNTHYSTARLSSEYSPLHHRYNTRAGPSSQELSICSEDPIRVQKGFDLGQPAEEHTSTEVRHTKIQTTNLGKHLKVKMNTEGSDLRTEEDSDVELTLGIGSGTNKKRSEHWLSLNNEISGSRPTPSDTRPPLLSTTVRPERTEECSDHSTGFDRESLQSPPWLFQALSLNKT